MASFVLNETQRRHLFRHLQDEFHAHVPRRLHKHRKAADLANRRIILGHFVEVELTTIACRQGDNRVGLKFFRVLGVLDGRLGIGSLDADDGNRPQVLVGLDDAFGTLDSFVEAEVLILAGSLRPDDAVDAGAVEEGHLLFEFIEGDLIVFRIRRLDDRKDAAKLLRIDGIGRAGHAVEEAPAKSGATQRPQETSAALSPSARSLHRCIRHGAVSPIKIIVFRESKCTR